MIDPHELFETDADDPLGFGLKSNAEPLQRWWLIGQGNPYWKVDVQTARTDLGLLESGFNDAAGYVDWLAQRFPIHGHREEWPLYLNIEGTVLQNAESMTRYTHRDLEWPIKDFEPPGPCCDTDPLYQRAGRLAILYGIDAVSVEPGFGNPDQAVVGYLLVEHWPRPRSLRGQVVIHEVDVLVDSDTGRRYRDRYKRQELGLETRGGQGRQLPLWYQWWKLRRDKHTITQIAKWTDSKIKETYDERSIRSGIDAVEWLMKAVEKPRTS